MYNLQTRLNNLKTRKKFKMDITVRTELSINKSTKKSET